METDRKLIYENRKLIQENRKSISDYRAEVVNITFNCGEGASET